jgi:voltage-dependent calcium channel T type alpha-1G
MFRVFRVVRLISRAEGLKIGLQALIMAVPHVLRIVMMLVLFFLIFGIIAISKFKGKFFSCDTDSVSGSDSNYDPSVFDINSKWDCYNAGADWVRSYYNFDNMYQTMATLFVLSIGAGWYPYMFMGASVTQIDYV